MKRGGCDGRGELQPDLIHYQRSMNAAGHLLAKVGLSILLLLVLLVQLAEALSVQPSTILLLPAAVPPAAEPYAVPVVVLEPIILNYTRHLSSHEVDEAALFSPFLYQEAESPPSAIHLFHSLHLLRPSTAADRSLVVHNVSFTQSVDSPASSAHSACASDALLHGLRITDCHALPAELAPNERVSLLLSYRPMPTAVPLAYYLLLHTSDALYLTQLHLVLPDSVAAYQRADFVSLTGRSPLLSVVSAVRSLLLSVPLLGFLAMSMLLFFAQTGQVHSTFVAALIHTLPVLPSLHAALAPYLYPFEASAKATPPAVPLLATLTAPTAQAAAPHQPSPMHALLRRKTANTAPATSQASSTLSTVSSPTASSVAAASLRAQSTDVTNIDSAPSSPLAAPAIDLPDSALDLTQITFRHYKSLSVGTGEAMMKEAERELRRKRRSGKQPTEMKAGQEQKMAEVDGVCEPDITSPPQTRRTMSVGSSGPLFFKFDRITAEMDERSSDGSRVGSESSSSTNASNSDSDEERPTSNPRKSSPQQPSQHSATVAPAASSISKPLDAGAQPFTPKSSQSSESASVSAQPPTAQPVVQAARPAPPAPTSYTPRASFYSSQRASPSPRSMYGGGSHNASTPRPYPMYEGKERQLAPTASFTPATLAATYPSYISPRHSAPTQRSAFSNTVSPAPLHLPPAAPAAAAAAHPTSSIRSILSQQHAVRSTGLCLTAQWQPVRPLLASSVRPL